MCAQTETVLMTSIHIRHSVIVMLVSTSYTNVILTELFNSYPYIAWQIKPIYYMLDFLRKKTSAITATDI